MIKRYFFPPLFEVTCLIFKKRIKFEIKSYKNKNKEPNKRKNIVYYDKINASYLNSTSKCVKYRPSFLLCRNFVENVAIKIWFWSGLLENLDFKEIWLLNNDTARSLFVCFISLLLITLSINIGSRFWRYRVYEIKFTSRIICTLRMTKKKKS